MTSNRSNTAASSFDPYAAENLRQSQPYTSSLLDESTDDERSVQLPVISSSQVPGAANYLEIEEEPPRDYPSRNNPQTTENAGIQTTSGLLLTHRKSASATLPSGTKRRDEYIHIEEDAERQALFSNGHGQDRHYYYTDNDNKKEQHSSSLFGSAPSLKRIHRNVEHYYQHPSHGWNDLRYMLKYTRFGVLVSATALVLGTTVLFHHMLWGSSSTVATTVQDASAVASSNESITDRVILMPLPLDGQPFQQQQLQQYQQQVVYAPPNGDGGYYRHLQVDPNYIQTMQNQLEFQQGFEQWAVSNQKHYQTPQEKHHRFQIWLENHFRSHKKNVQHGPCRMTRQPVFGNNLFSDLTREEFVQHYLTGYEGPRQDELMRKASRSLGVLGPQVGPPRHHPQVKGRHVVRGPKRGNYKYRCKWYDLSCSFQYIYDRYFYGFGTTMEPAYDADSYPMAVDWRASGAVTDVHSQGNCGACWAIGAIETIESAVFLKTGSLYDLSESEVIVCSEECEMCYGGWPQDAFDYVVDHGGVPLENDLPYDGDYLLELTKALNGESNTYDESTVEAYRQQVCPNKQGGGSHDDGNGGKYSNAVRYGEIQGYGYATDRCTCYSDGSGCDCSSQNEGLAIRNLATYGPAVVCVDAANWQDYNGGIITSASGCSQKFMDVNHCVQVVGYAFAESGGSSNQEEHESHDGDGSKDDENASRQGYWIVRNQWSQYWGMSGYAYVAMGENTCGILNDMVQVYA